MNSELLGIAFVVDDIHKGCKLVFRYPAPPASLDHVSSFHKISAPLIAKLFRPKNALCNGSFELVIDDLRFISHPVLVPRRANPSVSAGATAAATTAPPAVGGGASQGTGNAIASSFVATTGTPPTGTPPLSTPVAPTAPTGIHTSQQQQHRENDTTMFNVIFALDEHRQQPYQQRQMQYAAVGENPEMDEDAASRGPQTHPHEDQDARQQRHTQRIAAFRTIAAQLANGLLHEELRAGFVSREVRELLHIRDELLQNERVLLASTGSGTGSSSSASGTGGNNSSNLSGGGGGGGGGGGSNSKDAGEKTHQSVLEVDPQTLIDVSLGKSVLANDLKSVFHGLEESGVAHVVVNHWVKLSLTLTDAVSLQMHNLRPYQTLLLLTDEDTVLNALPPDHSHQLRVLVTCASPLKSFQDLTLETSIPIHQLFRLAAHLSYWGYGRVIDTITMNNIYQVHPKQSLKSSSSLALEFTRKFPPHELCEVLASVNGSRRVGETVKNLVGSKKVEYIHMLIWLLQRDFIIQLHRYIYFMIPAAASTHQTVGDHEQKQDRHPQTTRRRRNTSKTDDENDNGGGNDNDDDDDEHYDHDGDEDDEEDEENQSFGLNQSSSSSSQQQQQQLQQYQRTSSTTTKQQQPPLKQQIHPTHTSKVGLTDLERAYLDSIATTSPAFTLFKRLSVYFHGNYHFEEIMWRENVSRAELRSVLTTYSDIIVCCQHE